MNPSRVEGFRPKSDSEQNSACLALPPLRRPMVYPHTNERDPVMGGLVDPERTTQSISRRLIGIVQNESNDTKGFFTGIGGEIYSPVIDLVPASILQHTPEPVEMRQAYEAIALAKAHQQTTVTIEHVFTTGRAAYLQLSKDDLRRQEEERRKIYRMLEIPRNTRLAPNIYLCDITSKQHGRLVVANLVHMSGVSLAFSSAKPNPVPATSSTPK